MTGYHLAEVNIGAARAATDSPEMAGFMAGIVPVPEVGLQKATKAHEEARRIALRELADAGLSQSVIGDVLGVSHQRVHQLLRAS